MGRGVRRIRAFSTAYRAPSSARDDGAMVKHDGVPSSVAGGGWSLSDRLTLSRLASVPLLWVVALSGREVWLGVGVLLAALTDVVDGPLARRSGTATARGSRLDSIADHALTASTAAWIVLLRPAFVADHLPLLSAWIVVGVCGLLVAWLRFRRLGDVHLYSAKVAGTVGYALAVWLLVAGSVNAAVARVVLGIALLAALETLLVVSSRETVDEHVGSIVLPARRTTVRPARGDPGGDDASVGE